MEDKKHTPPGADKFRVSAREEFYELAEEAVEKNTGASFELVSRAFGLGDCSEEETRESWVELEERGYDLNAVNNDRSPEGLSVGQIMDQLERQKRE